MDPTYHIEVISGDSVTVTDNYYAGATLNAVSNGVSIIRITYDALDFVNTSNKSYIYSKLYEENTTVLVVNVGGNGVEAIDSGCGASEFEIQYFIRSINELVKPEERQYAALTFTPSENVTRVEAHKPVGSRDSWDNSWTEVQKNPDGSFTAHLMEGSNVLRFTVADGTTSYHVLRAIGLELTATGQTLNVSLEDGQFLLEAGTDDELTIVFAGLQMPLPKLAALINPGLESIQTGSGWSLQESTYVQYTLSGQNAEAQTIAGQKSQYNISTKNALTLRFDQMDTYTLSQGALHTTSFGAGSYSGMTRGGYTGKQPSFRSGINTSMDTRQNLYSAMPELTILICNHQWTQGTCTTASVCTRCGKVAGEAPGHSFETTTVAPTCLTDGYDEHKCENCDYSYRDTFVAATGHDTVSEVVAPTHDTMGYTVTSCKNCDFSFIHTFVDPEGHSFTKTVTREATCVTEGEWTFTCDCGESYTMPIPTTGHSCDKEVVEPTCKSMGYTTYTCKNCEFTFISNLVPAIECPSKGFTDVETGAWYHEAVDYAVANGLMNGTGAKTFEPNGTTTRSMMATLLYRMAGEPDVSGLKNPFTDVPAEAWYNKAVIWAFNEGVVTGASATTFNPDGALTREQLAVMLWRYANKPEADENVLNTFSDVKRVGAYAKTTMAWAVENGLVNGVGGNTLDPTGTATRAQIATILMRYTQN